MSKLDRLAEWTLDHPFRFAAIVLGSWLGVSVGLALLSPWFAVGFAASSGISVFRLAFQSIRFYVEDRELEAYYRGRFEQMERHYRARTIAEIYRNKVRGAA